MRKPVRYLLRGVIADAAILAAVSLYLLASIALNYEGRCGAFFFFGGAGRPCTRSEYVLEAAGFILFGVLDDTQTWVLILLALAALPLLGYLIGRRRGRESGG